VRSEETATVDVEQRGTSRAPLKLRGTARAAARQTKPPWRPLKLRKTPAVVWRQLLLRVTTTITPGCCGGVGPVIGPLWCCRRS
jgi:hypothetical protein